jgi:hypothetical protein
MVTRKTAKRKKGASEAPPEVPKETTVSEPVQPEKTPRFWTNSLNVVHESSIYIEKRDSAPATSAESIHTTPTYEPPKEQYDEESEDPFDVDFDESPVIPLSREEDPRRQDTSHEDKAESDEYFKQYLTASFHPVKIMAEPPNPITIQAVPNLTARPSSDSLYAMSYHRAKRACQTETYFRMNLSRDDMIKWVHII